MESVSWFVAWLGLTKYFTQDLQIYLSDVFELGIDELNEAGLVWQAIMVQ